MQANFPPRHAKYLAEVIIVRQLDNFTEENNIIEVEQFVFRKYLFAPIILVEHVTISLIHKQYEAAVFLDVKFFFDKLRIFFQSYILTYDFMSSPSYPY